MSCFDDGNHCESGAEECPECENGLVTLKDGVWQCDKCNFKFEVENGSN